MPGSKLLFATILVQLVAVAVLWARLSTLTSVSAQEAEPAPPAGDPTTQCIGNALAEFMNAVLDALGPGALANVKLVSPIFNLTNPTEREILDAMRSSGANFSSLDAFAGNTYSGIPNAPGVSASDWIGRTFAGTEITSRPLIITETGFFDKNVSVEELQQSFQELISRPNVIAAIHFTPTNTNPMFEAEHNIGENKLRAAISSNPSQGGINTGKFFGEISDLGQTLSNVGGGWAVQIARGPGDQNAIIHAANTSSATQFVRLCVGNACGFAGNPQALADMIRNIDNSVNSPVYISLGPNEPASEIWAAPGCGPVTLGGPAFGAEVGPDERPTCAQVQNPEFHSLRPYPGDTCNPVVEETTLICGNEFITTETFVVSVDQATQCNGRNPRFCNYIIDSVAELRVDLSDAELPIAGNTEDVKNSENNIPPGGGVSFVDRVNNYVSWYLNGTIQRAEEEYLDFQPSSRAAEELFWLINFSGPVRRLLPMDIQTDQRLEEKTKATLARRGDPDPNLRHDQIYVCMAGPIPGVCYEPGGIPLRLTNAAGGPGNPDFQYIPFSSTEDRKGRYNVKDQRENPLLGPFSAGEVSVANINYIPVGQGGVLESDDAPAFFEDFTLNTEFDILYHAHSLENNEVGGHLQNTYTPGGFPLTRDASDDTIPPEIGPNCTIVDKKTNPGDDMLGELNGSDPGHEDETDIQALLTYQARFVCVHDLITTESTTVDESCLAVGGTAAECTTTTIEESYTLCERTAVIPLEGFTLAKITNESPLVEDLWHRLVNGTMGVVRRVFPKLGGSTVPIDKFKEIPAWTNVTYLAQNQSAVSITGKEVDVRTQARAADKPGTQGELYIPFYGGIHEYFLKDLQEALRPKGIGASTGARGSLPGVGGSCSVITDAGNPCSVENLRPFFGDQAENASIICNRESGGSPFALNNSCLNSRDGVDNDGDGLVDEADPNADGATGDYSVGLFQINLLPRCPRAFADWSIGLDLNRDGRYDGEGEVQPFCTVSNQSVLDECVASLIGPEDNVRRAVEISSNGTNWRPWSAAAVCGVN